MKRHLILLFSILAGAAAAQTVMHNMVSRHTPVNTNLIGAVVGEGLSLSNGVLSSTGGGGTDGQSVTNIVEGIVADATNGVVRVVEGEATIDGALNVANDITTGGELNVSGNILGRGMYVDGITTAGGEPYNLYGGEWHYNRVLDDDGPDRELAVRGDLAPYAKTNDLGSAAYRDASEFATAVDEALVYQLLTNRLSGVTFDFATVAGLYLAISNIVAAQGGAITNFPAIP